MKRNHQGELVELTQRLTLEEYVFGLQLILQQSRHPGTAGVLIPAQAQELANNPKITETFYQKALRHGVLQRDEQGNIRLERNTDTLLKLIHKSRFCFTIQKDAWTKHGRLVSIYWMNGCYIAAVQEQKKNHVTLLLDHSAEAIYTCLENSLMENDGTGKFNRKKLNELLKQNQLPKSEIRPDIRIQGTLFDNWRDQIKRQYEFLLKKDRMEQYETDGKEFLQECAEKGEFKTKILELMRQLENSLPDEPSASFPNAAEKKKASGQRENDSKWTYNSLMADPHFPHSRIGYVWWILKNCFLGLKASSFKSAALSLLGYVLFGVFSIFWNMYGTCYLNDTFHFSKRSMWGDLTPYLLAGTLDTPSAIKGFQMNWGNISTEYIVLPLSITALLLLRGLLSRTWKGGITAVGRDLIGIPSLIERCRKTCQKTLGYFIGKGLFYSCIFGFLLFNPFAAALLAPVLLLSFAQGEDSALAMLLMTWRTAASVKKVESGKQSPVIFEEILLDIFGLSVGFFLYSIFNFVMWQFFDYHIILRLVLSVLLMFLALIRTGNGKRPAKTAISKKDAPSKKTDSKKTAVKRLAVFALCFLLAVTAAVLVLKTGIAFADDGGWTESGRTLEGLIANMGFAFIMGISVLIGLLTFGAGLAVAASIAAITFAGAGIFASATEYGHRTAEQIVYGRYNESDPTLLGTILDIGINFVPVVGNVWGLISGARDISYDVTHWENGAGDYINLGIDIFGFTMSGIGLKNDLDRLAQNGWDLSEYYGKTSTKEFVEEPFDENGNLKPNARYQSGEYDYYYETDEYGRIVSYETDNLQLTTRENRLPHNSSTPGKEAGDHAGHLFGDRFGGSGQLDNLVSQASEVNLSDYKIIENKWARALEEGKNVTVHGELIYEGTNLRPSGIRLEYTIDGEWFTDFLPNG